MSNEPSPPPVTLLGPVVAHRPGLPLVANLRSVELSDHPLLVSLRGATGRVARQALDYAQKLAAALPPELSARPAPDLPSLWECYQHEFARHSLAPALMNLEIARAALGDSPGARVRLVERRDGAWWLGGSGAREALREAAGLAPVAPPLSAAWWRHRLLPYLATRAPRAADTRADCQSPAASDLPADPCDVLFLGVAATTAPLIAHLTRGLEAQGLRCVAADFHYENSTAALRQAGVRVTEGRPDRCGDEAAAQALRRQFGTLRRQAQAAVREQVVAGLLPAWLEQPVGARLTVALGRDLPVMAAYRAAADRLLATARPRLVVGFHMSPDFLAPLLLAAQLRGATAVCAQHGIRGPVHRNGVALPWDYLFAWGQYTVDLYEGLADVHSRWVVTGNCLYDAAPDVGRGLRPPPSPLVLAATQTDEPQVKRSQPRWWLRGVAEACQALGARLVLRPHPAETTLSLYEELATDFPDTVQLPAVGERGVGLTEADVLVTRDSTVIYEAALAGRPVLAVALPPYQPRFPLAEHGGALGVTAYEDLQPALRDALTDGPRTQALVQRRPEFLRYHLGPPDGRATARTLAALQAALDAAPTPR